MKKEQPKVYKGKIKAVIFDWAGTTVDYGCFAPLIAVQEIFKKYQIEPTMKEIRKPMGLSKIEHITKMLKMRRIKKLWKEKYRKKPSKEDVLKLYAEFETTLLKMLPFYAKPINGVVETVNKLKARNIKIGTTTGYTREMINIIEPLAKTHGYFPDSIVTSSDVQKGRPAPLMCFQNAVNLNVHPLQAIVKVGDTLTDIKEGINAGMWSIGVIIGSSLLGLSEMETETMTDKEFKKKIKKTTRKYRKAGAHFVIRKMEELPGVIDEIEKRLSRGLKPGK